MKTVEEGLVLDEKLLYTYFVKRDVMFLKRWVYEINKVGIIYTECLDFYGVKFKIISEAGQ